MYRVEIIKKIPGFVKGEEKTLPLDAALHLKKKGIAKILGEVPTAIKAVKDFKSLDEKQNARIQELEDSVAELQILVKK